MMKFNLFLERRLKNPLRKQRLKDEGIKDFGDWDKLGNEWVHYVKYGELDPNDEIDQKFAKIREQYLKLKKLLHPRAEAFLQMEKQKYLDGLKSSRIKKSFVKIYEAVGITVYTDEYITEDFSKNSLNYRMVVNSVRVLQNYVRDILPLKKVSIVITNLKTNPQANYQKTTSLDISGLYYDRVIYIDQFSVDDPDIFIHEYAHFVEDSVSSDNKVQLLKSYKNLLDIFYKKRKIKRLKLQPTDPSNPEDVRITDANRLKISKILGFPEYGLTNAEEFFAVVIENWKKLPNNKYGYRFKQLVKNILTRL